MDKEGLLLSQIHFSIGKIEALGFAGKNSFITMIGFVFVFIALFITDNNLKIIAIVGLIAIIVYFIIETICLYWLWQKNRGFRNYFYEIANRLALGEYTYEEALSQFNKVRESIL